MEQKHLKIGWIGLGKMGLPICKRLRAEGIDVTVFARNEDGAQRADGEGFKTADQFGVLCAQADVIMTAVPDDAAIAGLFRSGLGDSLRPGQIFIDISTISPLASTEIAGELKTRGIAYLRAPVSGSTAHAASGNLTAMVSGPKSAFDVVESMLSIFAAKRFHLGDGEQARYLKLAINSILAATSVLVAEALALGEAGKLSRGDMLDVITQSAVASPLIGYKKDLLVRGEYPPAFTVSQILKDLDLILGAARVDHVPVPVNALIRQRFEQAYADGHGNEDFFCLSGPSKA